AMLTALERLRVVVDGVSECEGVSQAQPFAAQRASYAGKHGARDLSVGVVDDDAEMRATRCPPHLVRTGRLAPPPCARRRRRSRPRLRPDRAAVTLTGSVSPTVIRARHQRLRRRSNHQY